MFGCVTVIERFDKSVILVLKIFFRLFGCFLLPIAPTGGADKSSSATLLPELWQPSQDDIDYCKKNRPNLNISETVDAFKFYWLSQPKSRARKRNWSMAFKQWVLREKPQIGKQKPRNQSLSEINPATMLPPPVEIDAQQLAKNRQKIAQLRNFLGGAR